MASFTYDHVHLRSPDPEATAHYYAHMFGAEILRSRQSDGRERLDLNLGGLTLFIAAIDPAKGAADAPVAPYVGLEHIGLAVRGIDRAIAELEGKGAEVTMRPTTIRPGVRIAFLRGPEGVPIELVDRAAA